MRQTEIKEFIIFTMVGALILCVYAPIFKNSFVHYDNDAHIFENELVTADLGIHRITNMFRQTIDDIYVPITTLSFAIEHYFFGINPVVTHTNNLILHIFVCFLIFKITRILNFPLPVAAALFGVHPMHVESVAWATERKDVLYRYFIFWLYWCILFIRMFAKYTIYV